MDRYIAACLKRITITCLIIIMLAQSLAYANMVWPGAYMVNGIIKYYIVIINAILTFAFVRIIAKEASIQKVILVSAILILLLTVLGIFAIPICGLLAELVFVAFNIPTFSLLSWMIEYVACVLFYTLLDIAILQLVLKLHDKKTILLLLMYNLLVIGLAIVEILIIHPV